jgi:transcriptional regulator with XRE-family HTH domain
MLNNKSIKDHYYGLYMKNSQAKSKLPIPVKRVLRKLGRDIRDARRRRRIPVEIMSERTSMARGTLSKIENGDPGVSLGKYASVLHALGLIDRLGDVADAAKDKTGLQLEEEQLPTRIRLKRKKAEKKGPGQEGLRN